MKELYHDYQRKCNQLKLKIEELVPYLKVNQVHIFIIGVVTMSCEYSATFRPMLSRTLQLKWKKLSPNWEHFWFPY